MEGSPVKIGEREFIVPKLRVGTLRRATEIVAEIEGIDLAKRDPQATIRWFDGHTRAILELLRRNYPTLTRDELEDLLDADSVAPTFLAVMAAAGRKADDKGEAKGP